MKKEIQELFDAIRAIRETETNTLIQNVNNPDQGILIINEIEPQVTELKQILNFVSLDALLLLPKSRFDELQAIINPIIIKLKEIQDLQKNPNQSDRDQKQPYISYFHSESGDFKTSMPILWQLILESLTIINQNILNETDLNKKLESITAIEDSAKKIQDNLTSILESAKVELSKGGVSKHADIFNEQAKKHLKEAKKWRTISLKLIIINLIVAIIMYFVIVFFITELLDKIETGILTAILISFISYVIVQSVRNFFAEKHNEQINQHKANCLSTYNTFIDSADTESKSVILHYATQTIFSHQNTGYLSKESPTQNPNPIVEVLKNIPKTS